MNITDPLSTRARETPEAPAVLTAEATLSYSELDRAVSWVARSYSEEGLKAGDIVGIHLENQVQHTIACMALARMGAGQFAFHPTDPPRVRQELAHRLGIVATIADGAELSGLETPIIRPPSDRLGDFKKLGPVEFATADDGGLPLLLLSTSGTETGLRKLGVMNHADAVGRIPPLILDGPASRFYSITKLDFHGAKQDMFRCFLHGSCLAFSDADTVQTLVEFIARYRINYLAGSPIHAATLLTEAKENSFLLPGVEVLRISSTLVPDALRQDIQERLTANLYIMYGMAEIGKVTVAEPEIVKTIPGVVGKVVPSAQVDIINDDGEILPPGHTGRLRIKGAGMMKGYIGEPAGSDETFRDGWFYSGDLGEFTPDNQLIHHGRADDMMIFDGINIFPVEIENALLRHPAVAEVAAFSIRSVEHGDIPIAAVVIKSQVSEKELRSHCRSWLGANAPSGLMIGTKLPRNAVGKVLRNELVRQFRRQIGIRQAKPSSD